LRTKAEYNRAVAVLDDIVDEIGQQETHPLADLAETLSLSIQAHESAHVPISDSSVSDILHHLMQEHGLTQSELPEIGTQGMVSEILSGKRRLNVRQIARLAERFGVSPAVFLPTHTQARSSRRRTRPAAKRKQSSRVWTTRHAGGGGGVALIRDAAVGTEDVALVGQINRRRK
jgi:HTH-type transcriptional regulator / antitoxin HigA